VRVVSILLVLGWVFAGAPAHAALLSPGAGAIREVVIAIPPDDLDEHDLIAPVAAEALQMIARALGPDVRYLIHAYPRHRSVIETVLGAAGVKKLRFAPSAFGNYTRWTRDMFVVANNGGKRLWLLPAQILRRLDDSVGAEIAATIGQATVRLPLNVEGGNLVPFGDWVFAGKDLLLNGTKTLDLSRRTALQRALAPDSHWVWVGNDLPIPHATAVGIFQPLFHIDMFLTPVKSRSGARPHLVIGSTVLAEKLGGVTSPPEIGRRLDEVAAHLLGVGFTVSRIPLLVQDDGDTITVVNYNNVLFDGDAGQLVIVPQYAQEGANLKVLDDYAAQHFEELGYQVRRVHGPLLELGQQLGGLRCLIQVIERN